MTDRTVVLRLLEEVLEAPANSLSGDERLSDLDHWDSLAILTLMALLDERLGLEIAPDDIVKCTSVAQLADKVCSLQPSPDPHA